MYGCCLKGVFALPKWIAEVPKSLMATQTHNIQTGAVVYKTAVVIALVGANFSVEYGLVCFIFKLKPEGFK